MSSSKNERRSRVARRQRFAERRTKRRFRDFQERVFEKRREIRETMGKERVDRLVREGRFPDVASKDAA